MNAEAIKQCRERRDAKLRRNHEIEMLLDAGLSLAEAIETVDSKPEPFPRKVIDLRFEPITIPVFPVRLI